MDIKSTEREVASWLSDEINTILKKGGYPFESATVETSARGLFPDITIWISRENSEAFAFFELKPPQKQEDSTVLADKSSRLNAKYMVIWNFNDGYLFDVTDRKPVCIKNYPTYLFSNIEEWKREDVKNKIRKSMEIFLADLKELCEKGHLHDFLPDKLFFIDKLRNLTDALYPIFEDHFKIKTRDRKLKETIDSWAVKQGIARTNDQLFYPTLSKQWAYSLVTKVIFYFALRKHFPNLPDINTENVDEHTIVESLINAFQEAQKMDWQAVFEPGLYDKLGIPKSANRILLKTLDQLHKYNFSGLKEDVIGEIFEDLIPYDERHSLGQYFTREDLVDFIIGFVVQEPSGAYMDPTCGSGTFLNRLYSRLRWGSAYKLKHHDLLKQLWGVDIAHFPAELATINLFRQDVADYSNFPRVVVRDFFEVTPGMQFEFPPPKAIPGQFVKVREDIPMFRGIVGNFPYIRQELIEKKNKNYKKYLTKELAKAWLLDFPELFETDFNHFNNGLGKAGDKFKKEWIESKVDDGRIKLKLSGQADIYAYLFLHASRFLENSGRMGIVTSNSWLDVSYGYHLKNFFLNKFKIVAIVGSWVEPWFEDASINTVFTVLEKCDDEEAMKNNEVKFIKLNRKLTELIPFPDLKLQDADRWQKIESLVRTTVMAGPDLAHRMKNAKYTKFGDFASFEDDNFRIRIIKQESLLKELQAKEHLAKWGKYIRAPDVFFDILEKAGDKLVPLKELADVRFGIKTGINEFFYLEPSGKASRPNMLKVKNDKGWEGEIEKEFLKPIIKSPKESDSIVIDPKKLKYRIFVCPFSKSDLKKSGKIGALRYIEWGEKQKTKENVSFPDVSSVKGRRYWWEIDGTQRPPVLWLKAFDDRFLALSNQKKLLSSDRMYEITLNNKKNEDVILAFLNSTFGNLLVEINGRVNLGDGALDNMTYEASECLVIKPTSLTEEAKRKLDKALTTLKKRPIENIFNEVKRNDRRNLDSIILGALGLEPKKYIPRIYNGLCGLVRERLQLPQMRKEQKKEKIRKSIEDIKNQVEEELLSAGPRTFPESFVSDKDFKNSKEIPISGKPIKIGEHFFGMFDITDEDNQKIYEAKGIDEAKFVIYSYKPNIYVLKIPRAKLVVEKALKEYEVYIDDLKEKLITRVYEATFDHRAADRITNEILEGFGIKLIRE